MLVECDVCGLSYNDEYRWTICPHHPLEASSDGKGYCREHDLFNCPNHEVKHAGVYAESDQEGTGAQSSAQAPRGGDQASPQSGQRLRWYPYESTASKAEGRNVRRPSSEIVLEFHEKFGLAISDVPTVASYALRRLRIALIAEELKEFADACGVHLEYTLGGKVGEPKLLEMADGLIDLDYVVSGAMLCFGIDQVAGVVEVHRSNMTKLGEDGMPIIRDDGKIMKGPNYQPPSLSAVLGIPK
jgi:predicted HAD superfamily Cof-like phosphohydrolase